MLKMEHREGTGPSTNRFELLYNLSYYIVLELLQFHYIYILWFYNYP